MWKEIISYEDMVIAANLRNSFGCVANYSADIMKAAIERKKDCHFFYFKNDRVELLKGYKEKEDFISLITYTVKAEIKDYPEALRLMGEMCKEYLKSKTIKKIIFQQGSKDEVLMNTANLGVGKVGFSKFVEIITEEYKKVGVKVTFTKDEVIKELI